MCSTIGLDLMVISGTWTFSQELIIIITLETIMLYGGQADVRYDTREMREGSSKKTQWL